MSDRFHGRPTISLFQQSCLFFWFSFLFSFLARPKSRAFVLHEIKENITRSRLQSFPFEFRSLRVKFWFKESWNVLVAGGRCLKELQKAVLISDPFFLNFISWSLFFLFPGLSRREILRLKTTLNRLLCFGPHSNFYSNDHPIASRKRKKTIDNSRGCSDVTPPPHVSPSLPWYEGLNGVNRQMALKLTVNRQKRNIFTVNRQMSEPKLAVKLLRYPSTIETDWLK